MVFKSNIPSVRERKTTAITEISTGFEGDTVTDLRIRQDDLLDLISMQKEKVTELEKDNKNVSDAYSDYLKENPGCEKFEEGT